MNDLRDNPFYELSMADLIAYKEAAELAWLHIYDDYDDKNEAAVRFDMYNDLILDIIKEMKRRVKNLAYKTHVHNTTPQ